MAKIISASINLSKINKSKIIDGEKGKYYNLNIIVNDEKDQYGNDVSVIEQQTKEERTSRAEKTYLGNGRVIWTGESRKPQQAQTQDDFSNPDDLPF